MAQSNIALQYAGAGVPVDLEAQYKRVMETFEGVDPEKLIKPQDPMAMMQPPQQGGGGNIPMPEGQPNPGSIPL